MCGGGQWVRGALWSVSGECLRPPLTTLTLELESMFLSQIWSSPVSSSVEESHLPLDPLDIVFTGRGTFTLRLVGRGRTAERVVSGGSSNQP